MAVSMAVACIAQRHSRGQKSDVRGRELDGTGRFLAQRRFLRTAILCILLTNDSYVSAETDGRKDGGQRQVEDRRGKQWHACVGPENVPADQIDVVGDALLSDGDALGLWLRYCHPEV